MTVNASPIPFVEVRGLSKKFGGVGALDRASFSVGRGLVVGLIGPNGAGKTTLMECMAGLLAVDAGEVVSGAGQPVAELPRPAICFIPDGITPWESRPVEWALRFFEAFHDAEPGTRLDLIEQLDLATVLHQSIGELSRGQRKRVLIALGLLTRSPLLLIDEPFEGLDLRQTRHLAAVLRAHARTGRAILLSIHQLADAARVCDRMVLLTNGAVVGAGTHDELRRAAGLPDGSLEDVFLALT